MKKIITLITLTLLATHLTNFGLPIDEKKLVVRLMKLHVEPGHVKELNKAPMLPQADTSKTKEDYYASKNNDKLYLCHYKEKPCLYWGFVTDLDNPEIQQIIDQKNGDATSLQWHEINNSEHLVSLNDGKDERAERLQNLYSYDEPVETTAQDENQTRHHVIVINFDNPERLEHTHNRNDHDESNTFSEFITCFCDPEKLFPWL